MYVWCWCMVTVVHVIKWLLLNVMFSHTVFQLYWLLLPCSTSRMSCVLSDISRPQKFLVRFSWSYLFVCALWLNDSSYSKSVWTNVRELFPRITMSQTFNLLHQPWAFKLPIPNVSSAVHPPSQQQLLTNINGIFGKIGQIASEDVVT